MPKDFFSYGTPAAPAPGAEPARAILTGLSDEDWQRFIGFAARRRYPDGAVIVALGARDVPLGFVAGGSVLVQPSAGAAVVRSEGELFCMLGFLAGTPSDAAVSARGTAGVLLLTPEALTQLAAWQPRIAVALLRDLAGNVAERLRRVALAD